MLSMVDSFVKYLHTELSAVVPIHWARVNDSDAQSHRLKENALNVYFISFPRRGSKEEALVSLDLIGTDERTVLKLAEQISDKLHERQYTPEFQFDPDPAAPVATGRSVAWDSEIEFQVVAQDHHYVHLNATFPIYHAR